MKIVIRFIFLVILLSCNFVVSNDHEENEITYLPLKNVIDKNEEIYLSSFFNHIKYIPLETNRKSLFRSIDKIIVTDKYIIISDYFKLFLFDLDGKFIKNISNRGNSFDEYIYVNDIIYDDINEVLCLITHNKIIKYNSNFDYIDHVNIEFNSHCSIKHHTNSLFFYTGENILLNDYESDIYNIIETDTLGNIIQRYKNHSPRKREINKGGYFATSKRPLYIYKGNVFFNEFGNDTLLNVNCGQYDPAVIFDLGSYKMNHNPSMVSIEEQKRVMDELKQKVYISDILEDTDLFYIVLSWGWGNDLNSYIVYDKERKELRCSGAEKLINDLDGGVSFFPNTILNNNLKVSWCGAEEFKNDILSKDTLFYSSRFGDKFKEVYEMALSLSFDDNPVILIVD